MDIAIINDPISREVGILAFHPNQTISVLPSCATKTATKVVALFSNSWQKMPKTQQK